MNPTNLNGVTSTKSTSELAQIEHARELWEKLYGTLPSKHHIIMSAVNSLVARMETELSESD